MVNPPLALAANNGELSVSNVDGAHYALAAVVSWNTLQPGQLRYYNVRGQTAIGFFLPYRNGSLFYASTRHLGSSARKLTQACAVSLISDEPLIVYSSHVHELVTPAAVGKPMKRIDGLEKAQSNIMRVKLGSLKGRWPNSAVTGEHHTLVRPEEAILACREDRAYELSLAWLHIARVADATLAFVSGLLLWAGTADRRLTRALFESDGSRRIDNMSKWMDWAKRVSSQLKAHQHYTDLPLEQMFELNVLANRGQGEIDWDGERANRTKPQLVQLPDSVVYDSAVKIFAYSRGSGYTYPRERWSEFWTRRWASVPTGSVHSQYSFDNDYVSKRNRAERNKNFTVISMPSLEMETFASRMPEIVAWKSVKYEWAKMRAIYGTDLTSYLLTDFAMPSAEEALAAVFPVGRKANEKYVSQRLSLAGATGISVCFDYEDFNSQHSLKSMAEVIQAYFDVFETSMSDEQRVAMNWVIQSVYKQRIAGDESYETKGTLLSGWRLTTFVNTMLNKIYLEHAGALSEVLDSVHNGDDVLAYTTTLAGAQHMLSAAHEAGIRAQPAKCTIAGIEEFLRVDRVSPRSTGSQYLARGIATAVHARAESGVPETLLEQVRSQMTRIDELESRGAGSKQTNYLRERAVVVAAKAFSTDEALVLEALTTHSLHGGLSDDKEAAPKYRFETNDSSTSYEHKRRCRKLPGVNDYAKYLIKLFKISNEKHKDITQKIGDFVARSTTLSRPSVSMIKISDVEHAKVEQQLAGVCKNDFLVKAHTGRARLAGVPLGQAVMRREATMASTRIAISKDPLRTMKVIF